MLHVRGVHLSDLIQELLVRFGVGHLGLEMERWRVGGEGGRAEKGCNTKIRFNCFITKYPTNKSAILVWGWRVGGWEVKVLVIGCMLYH